MSLFALSVLGAVIAAVAAAFWFLRARDRALSESASRFDDSGKPRFETTMNELRSVREALRSPEPRATGTKRPR
jgi:hypothetical protein